MEGSANLNFMGGGTVTRMTSSPVFKKEQTALQPVATTDNSRNWSKAARPSCYSRSLTNQSNVPFLNMLTWSIGIDTVPPYTKLIQQIAKLHVRGQINEPADMTCTLVSSVHRFGGGSVKIRETE